MQADGQVAQDGHDLRAAAGAGLVEILTEGDVPHPVELVLDVPVAADPGGRVSGLGLFGGQGADGVDDLAAPAALTVDRRADAGALDGLGGVREPEPGRDGDRLDGAVLDPAVAVAGVDVADRDVLPGQRFSVACRVGWLPFTVTSRCALGRTGIRRGWSGRAARRP